jgi:riboflavin kinase/FMN adenylyltransferase
VQVVAGLESLRSTLRRTVVTIGNFDGVHRGHVKIIGDAIAQARGRGGPAVVFTFRPHPHAVLRPETPVHLLTTYDEKAERIAALGPDYLVEQPFSREFSETPAEQFFTDLLLHRLSAEAIVVGYDFAFGRERQGHLAQLEAWSRASGVELFVVPPQRAEGEVVSSSRIRQHLAAGALTEGNRLLGYEYFYRSVVRRGEQRGRKLGFPTANLHVDGKLMLPNGVYATRAVVAGRAVDSVTNIGVRPTFVQASEDPSRPIVETHLIDADEDLYGVTLEVRFLARLREERRFSGPAELKEQIGRDVQAARRALKESSV